MMRAMLLMGMMLWGALGAPLLARAEARYAVTVIGGAGSAAYDVNASGQVVGQLQSGGRYAGFFYDGSVLSDLGTLGYDYSIAAGLNDNGTVVGTAWSGTWSQAFVYADGAASVLAFPDRSEANGINNAGVVVGTASAGPEDGGWSKHGFTYANSLATDLGTIPDGYSSFAYGINEAGAVTGGVEWSGPTNFPTHPFLHTDGAMRDLGDFGGVFGYGYAINNLGQVVGAAGSAESPDFPDERYPRRAFLYQDGVMQDLGALVANGSSVAYDINDTGQVVGYTATGYAGEGGAFLYAGGQMVLLDSLLDPAGGWTVTDARAINAVGQIAGSACKDDLCYAVRLDPTSAVPEPGPGWMLGAGLIGLGCSRRAGRARRARRAACVACIRRAPQPMRAGDPGSRT